MVFVKKRLGTHVTFVCMREILCVVFCKNSCVVKVQKPLKEITAVRSKCEAFLVINLSIYIFLLRVS